MKTIAIDFDGVIHSYSSGWKGPGVINDPPVSGAKEFIKAILEDSRFRMVIFTSRVAGEKDPDKKELAKKAIRKYLIEHCDLSAEEVKKISISASKPHATVYIDDRAWNFEGTFPTLDMLDAFKPWNKRQHKN